ncbi:heavy-metal-associated domain-containing protein [Nocardia speluncae]|uniref:Heavy-metal-associated domain-containing protein n=1 Tax=Nocardia speluncae TaxID=419477 RepID=A0A846XIJ2_9NOCA|nr:heavy-metal-associated domain-containing protein [Nocardia speluncae]NKY35327.1 heavy-metal-associated domain-containing protein [Nocardia speluncae]
MTTSKYHVNGMTCQHCASFVTEEIERIPGVTGVAVDLDSGQVSVRSEVALHIADVRAAVEEAGYELTSARSAKDDEAGGEPTRPTEPGIDADQTHPSAKGS